MEMRFFVCNEDLRKIWNKYGIYFSEKFCAYFSNNVQEIMYREAGLKPSFKVGLSLFRPHEHNLAMYQPGAVSRINTAISILPYFTDPISFCWRSKTGRLVLTYTEDFDEPDLECWIEGMKPHLYWEQLNQASANHPLKIKNLPYELLVLGIGTHMGLTIELTDATNAKTLLQQLYREVEKHNQKSEAKNRDQGVVHNCSGEVQGSGVVFRIDVGSAGVVFLKKPLRVLAKISSSEKSNSRLVKAGSIIYQLMN